MKRNFSKMREGGKGGGRRGGGHREGGFRESGRRGDGRRDKIYVYGKHALGEALASMPQVVRKVFLSREAMSDEELRELLKRASIAPESLKTPQEADRMVGDETAHQGVIAVIDAGALVTDLDDFTKQFSDAWYRSDAASKTLLVLLDELTDPHNVGAIIRSAAAFGAAGVLMPTHNQAPVTGAVAKASAGMVFRVPLVTVHNVNQAVDALSALGFRSYGLAMDGARVLGEEEFAAPSLLIVGNEGTGIRQKTLERCDVRLQIPMDARAESLNASVSAAVAMYQWYAKKF